MHDGVVHVSETDTSPYVYQWDTNASNAYISWYTGSAVADISVDPTTGELYALTQYDVRRRTSSGGSESLGLTSAYYNYGGDLEVYSIEEGAAGVVPEATSVAVWALLG